MKVFFSVFSIFLFVFIYINSYGQWLQNGPQGGVVYTMAVRNNGVIYAGTGDGVYFSDNYGQSWQKYTSAPYTFKKIISIAFMEPFPYAVYATDGQYLYSSGNDGYNWNYVSSRGGNTLAINNSTIYLGGYHSGVSYSTNGGSNWISTNLGNSLSIYDFFIWLNKLPIKIPCSRPILNTVG